MRWRFRPALAAGLLILSLGLPWREGPTISGVYTPGVFLPGYCPVVPDAYGYFQACDPVIFSPGIMIPGSAGIGVGKSHRVRFPIVATLAVIVVARRRSRRVCLRNAGVGLMVFAATTAVATITSGLILALVASALLIAEGWGGRRISKRRRVDKPSLVATASAV